MAINQNPFAVGVPANLNNPRGATTGGGRPGMVNPNAIDVKPMSAGLQQQVRSQPTLTLQQQLNRPTVQQQLNQPQPTLQQQQQQQQQQQLAQSQIAYAPSLNPRGAITGGGRPGLLAQQMGYRKF